MLPRAVSCSAAWVGKHQPYTKEASMRVLSGAPDNIIDTQLDTGAADRGKLQAPAQVHMFAALRLHPGSSLPLKDMPICYLASSDLPCALISQCACLQNLEIRHKLAQLLMTHIPAAVATASTLGQRCWLIEKLQMWMGRRP